ncbi:FecR family protein [Campylobacter geochelonis]|uniref:FecR protein n=1 Tax=Campylobacter geochelonis TaxID=1780362 RepID=A0A128EBW6_9BACT|nr:FecR domain-containing protein [Campylobacter geochelonis]QKF70494.1 FecR domain-containing protein [Campylobacter geochelonis]CZE46172.1 FecR protein [Campylobacter geochelonis]CZE46460.1 FecR protein [Campylobacter geochelonis]CZE50465.1 FecR protein [Campylobacter geochelonis]
MKKIFSILLLMATFAFSADDIAIIKMIEGSPQAKRGEKVISLNIGDKLKNNDIIITNSSSKIGVIFNDGSSLTIGESSFLNIEKFEFKPIEDIYKFSLKLDKGKALFQSGKIGELSPDNFSLKVPDGIIGIRGTKFLVKLN